jgi:probable rRNA maturation factor
MARDTEDGPALLNRQRRVRVPAAPLRAFLRRVQGEVTGGRAFSLCVVSDRVIRRYNRDYRGLDCATDVLSFPDDSPHWAGDVLVSAETAQRQARLRRHSVKTEIQVLALHGVLHLLGKDHESPRDRGRMARLEQRWRLHFSLPGGLLERSRRSGE